MSMFTLIISCLTTSNLPWFMDLAFQVPMQYCCLQHWTLLLSPVTSTTGCCFCFGSLSSFFWSYFSTEHIGHLPTCRVHLSVSYLFAFSYCSWGSQGKNAEVVCHSLLHWTTFCQTSPPWPTCLGWPHRAWLSFTELDKAVVRVIRLTSFLWLWFQCVCPHALSQHLPSYLGFSYLGHGVSLHGCSSKAQLLLLTLDGGYLLTAAPPDLLRGVALLGPPPPMQQTG